MYVKMVLLWLKTVPLNPLISSANQKLGVYTCVVESRGDTSFLSELTWPEQTPFPGITCEHLWQFLQHKHTLREKHYSVQLQYGKYIFRQQPLTKEKKH